MVTTGEILAKSSRETRNVEPEVSRFQGHNANPVQAHPTFDVVTRIVICKVHA